MYAQRTHEIGIRAALGASTSNVVGLILKWGMLMTLGVELLGALALTLLLAALLFGVGARDPLRIAGAGEVLAAIALLAS